MSVFEFTEGTERYEDDVQWGHIHLGTCSLCTKSTDTSVNRRRRVSNHSTGRYTGRRGRDAFPLQAKGTSGDVWPERGRYMARRRGANRYQAQHERIYWSASLAARYPLVKLGSSVHKYQRSWHVRNMEFEHVVLLGATGRHELLRATRKPVKYRRI